MVTLLSHISSFSDIEVIDTFILMMFFIGIMKKGSVQCMVSEVKSET